MIKRMREENEEALTVVARLAEGLVVRELGKIAAGKGTASDACCRQHGACCEATRRHDRDVREAERGQETETELTEKIVELNSRASRVMYPIAARGAMQ